MNIDDKIRMLLKLLRDLNNTIQRENHLLTRQAGQETLRDVLEQKHVLLAGYEQQVKLFKDNAELVNADRGLWRRLIDETEAFNILIDENKLKLLSKIEVTKRIFAIIQDAAKDYKSSVSTYSKSGTTKNQPQQPFQPAVSVGLNQEL